MTKRRERDETRVRVSPDAARAAKSCASWEGRNLSEWASEVLLNAARESMQIRYDKELRRKAHAEANGS